MCCSIRYSNYGIDRTGTVCSPMIEQYLNKCKADKLAKDTIRDKRRHLLLYFSQFSEINSDNLDVFLSRLNGDCAEKKIRRDLRMYVKHLNEKGFCSLPYTYVKNIPDPSKQRPMMFEDEFKLMLDKCDDLIEIEKQKFNQFNGNQFTKGKSVYVRWKYVLLFMWDTGLRVSEVCNLKIENIDFLDKSFWVLGKNRKWRQGWYQCDIGEYLNLYKPQEVLFNITPKCATAIVARLRKQCGITRKVTAHSIRHTYATELIENGANIIDVMNLCGHSQVTTTQIYSHSINLRKKYKMYKSRLNNNSNEKS